MTSEILNALDPGEVKNIPSSISNVLPPKRNFKRIGIHGDGSCLFHSFLYCYDEEYRNSKDEVKQKIIGKKRDSFAKKVTEIFKKGGKIPTELINLNNVLNQNETLDKFLKEIADTNEWYGEEAIILIEYVYKINIVFFQHIKKKTNIYCRAHSSNNINKKQDIIILLNINNVHFEPVVEFDKNNKHITNTKFSSNNDVSKKLLEEILLKCSPKKEEGSIEIHDSLSESSNNSNENSSIEDNSTTEDENSNSEDENSESNSNADNSDAVSDINTNSDADDYTVKIINKSNVVFDLNNSQNAVADHVKVQVVDKSNPFINYSDEKLSIEIAKLLYNNVSDNKNKLYNYFHLYNHKSVYASYAILNSTYIKVIPICKAYKKLYFDEDEMTEFEGDENLLSTTQDFLSQRYNIIGNRENINNMENVNTDSVSYFDQQKRLYDFENNAIYLGNYNYKPNANNEILSDCLLPGNSNSNPNCININENHSKFKQQIRVLTKQTVNTRYTEQKLDCSMGREASNALYLDLNEVLYQGDNLEIVGFNINNNAKLQTKIINFKEYFNNLKTLKVNDKVYIEFNDNLINNERTTGLITSLTNEQLQVRPDTNILSEQKTLSYNLKILNNGFFIFKRPEDSFNKHIILAQNSIVLLYRNIDVTLSLINYTISELLSRWMDNIYNLNDALEYLNMYGYDLKDLSFTDSQLLNKILQKNVMQIGKAVSGNKMYKVSKLKFSNIISQYLNYNDDIVKGLLYINEFDFVNTNLNRISLLNKQYDLGYIYFLSKFTLNIFKAENKYYEQLEIKANMEESSKLLNQLRANKEVKECARIKITLHLTSMQELKSKLNNEFDNKYAMIHYNEYKKIYKLINKEWTFQTILGPDNSLASCDNKVYSFYDNVKEHSIYDPHSKKCVDAMNLKILCKLDLLENHIKTLEDINKFVNNAQLEIEKYSNYIISLKNISKITKSVFEIKYADNDKRLFTGNKEHVDFDDMFLNLENFDNPGVQAITGNKNIKFNNQETRKYYNDIEILLLEIGLSLSPTEILVLANTVPSVIDFNKNVINLTFSKGKLTQENQQKKQKALNDLTSQYNIYIYILALIVNVITNRKNNTVIKTTYLNKDIIKLFSLDDLEKLVKFFSEFLVKFNNETPNKFIPNKQSKELLIKLLTITIAKAKESKILTLYNSLFIKESESKKINNLWNMFKPKLISCNKNISSSVGKYICNLNLELVKYRNLVYNNNYNVVYYFDEILINSDINYHKNNNNKHTNLLGSAPQDIFISNQLYFSTKRLDINIVVLKLNLSKNVLNITNAPGKPSVAQKLSNHAIFNKYNDINIAELLYTSNADHWNKLIDHNNTLYNFITDKSNMNDITFKEQIEDFIISFNNLGKDPKYIEKINKEFCSFMMFDLKHILSSVFGIVKKPRVNKKIYPNKEKIMNIIEKYKKNTELLTDFSNNEKMFDKFEQLLLNINKVSIEEIINTVNAGEQEEKLNKTNESRLNSEIKKLFIMTYYLLKVIMEIYLFAVNDEDIILTNNDNLEEYNKVHAEHLYTEKFTDNNYKVVNPIAIINGYITSKPENQTLYRQLNEIVIVILKKLRTKIIQNIRSPEELKLTMEKLRETAKKKELNYLNNMTDEERSDYIINKKLLGIQTIDYYYNEESNSGEENIIGKNPDIDTYDAAVLSVEDDQEFAEDAVQYHEQD